jgi:hypothetical protein
VSSLDGSVGTAEKPVPYRFTAADFELISTAGDANLDAIRFRDGGRRPIPNSDLTVNYYPVQTPPVPVNDLNVGSVVRTLLETVAVEMAVEISSKSAAVNLYGTGFSAVPTEPSRLDTRLTGRFRSLGNVTTAVPAGAFTVSRTVPPVSVVIRSRTIKSYVRGV